MAPKHKQTKRTLKFLAQCKPGKCMSSTIREANPAVIKSICNATLNIQQNPKLKLSRGQRKVFAHYKRQFNVLTNPAKSIEQKRRLLSQQQGGALPFIAPLLSVALPLLGSLIFSRNS